MAKIQLSTKAKIEIEDNGKIVKTFNVTFREPTRKESKKLGKDNKDIIDIFGKAQSLAKRAEVLENKVEALKELGKSNELLKATNKLETIYDEQDGLDEKYEALGGADKFNEASKSSYETSVGGKDKEALAEFAESESNYDEVLRALREDVKDNKGK